MPTACRSGAVTALALIICLFETSQGGAQTPVTSTWINGSPGSVWANAAHWTNVPNLGSYPNNDGSFVYDVVVNSTSSSTGPQLDANPATTTVRDVTLRGAIFAFNSSRTLTVTRNLTTDSLGAELRGTDATRILTANLQGTMTVNGSLSVPYSNLTHSGSQLIIQNSGSITNTTVSSLVVQQALEIRNNGTVSVGTLTFNGPVSRTTSAGTASIRSVNFFKSGAWSIESGTLNVIAGSQALSIAGAWSGTAAISSGAILGFDDGSSSSFVDVSGASFSGAGTVVLRPTSILRANAFLDFSNAMTNFESGSRIEGTGNVSFSGAVTKSVSGLAEIHGTGSLVFQSPLTVLGGQLSTGQRIVTSQSTSSLTGSLTIGSSGQWINQGDMTLARATGDSTLISGGGQLFNQVGSILKPAGTTNTVTISMTNGFENAALIEVRSGTLSIDTTFNQTNSGRLLLNGGNVRFQFGSSSRTIQGTIEGAGTITHPGITIEHLNGTLHPGGTTAGTIGTLTLTGSLTMNATSNLQFDLGSTSDLIMVNQNLTLNGTLSVNAVAGFGVGTYTIIDYSGTLTDFGLDLGTMPAGFNYSIANDVANTRIQLNVTPVPEASTIILPISLIGGWLVRSIRSRARSAGEPAERAV